MEKNHFEEWMRRIMERLDRLENRMTKPPEKEKEKKERHTFNGEMLLDNHDLCVMLNVSKRTLQRYRSLGWLPFERIDQKTYYLESEVERFIHERMKKTKGLS
jgi:DNA-binding transcriptional MerR regulator